MTKNIKTLGTVAEYINGRAFKPDEWEQIGKPIIRIQNLTHSSEVCNRTTKNFDKKFLITSGDLLFSWSATLGAFIWRGEDAWLNQHIFKVIPNDDVEKLYLYYYLKFIIDKLQEKTHGSGMVHITLKPFKETEIPLPPIDEQKRIVEVIESLFSKLDAAKGIVQKIFDGYELRRAAILHKAFTGELTKNFRAKNNLSLDDWQQKKLGDISESQYGYTAKALRNELLPKLLRITDIQNGLVDWANVPNCQIENSQLEKYLLHDKDIVIARTGATTGKSFILKNPVNAVFASYLIRLKILEMVEPYYCYYFLQSSFYWNQILDLSAGIAQPGVNAKKLQTIKIPIPLIDEQKEIVRILDSLIEKETRTKDFAEKILSEIELLKRTILARAFRGKLLK